MKQIKLLSEGVLYRNSNPGFKAECAFLPNVVPLSDQEILCFYRLGSAFYALDGRIALLRSTDGGQSWRQDGLVWDPRWDASPYNYSAPHGARLRDGTLLLTCQRYDGSDPELPLFNPATGGLRPMEVILFRSTDNGHTWSEPRPIDFPGGGIADPPSQIIELNDGTLFLAGEIWKTWDDTSPLHIKGFAVFSHDRGQTWGERIDLPSASDPHRMYSHSRYTRMLDGQIGVLQWTQEVGTNKDLDLHLAISDLSGRKWSQPQPTGLPAQTSWLADLGNGLLFATYTKRTGMQPGIYAVISEDGGRTWDLEHEVVVWDAVGQEWLGVEQKPAYPASHMNIAFGKPNTARLFNGEIISSWWCTQACVTHARFARLAVE
ncbi:MAG: exo-alpha-sialidase [Chloroflexi bacterium]|nr:exo-alpha-sialidase [Chloroflexota bacterium]